MSNTTFETFQIVTAADVVLIRKTVRGVALTLGFGIIDQTKIVTAASELARNTLEYGGGGRLTIETLRGPTGKPGVRLKFEDEGPGIADISRALTDGFTTGTGLGMGLSGSRRLMSEFSISSEMGKGTCIIVTKWK